MQELSILIGISQLGAVFTGFIAIFLVFARKDGHFSRADSLRIRSLLYGSFGVVVGALTPLIIASFDVSGEKLWRYSAMIVFILGSLISINVARYHLGLSPEEKNEAGRMHSIVTWGLNFASTALMFSIIVGSGGWSFYLLALAFILAITMINFLTLSLQRLL